MCPTRTLFSPHRRVMCARISASCRKTAMLLAGENQTVISPFAPKLKNQQPASPQRKLGGNSGTDGTFSLIALRSSIKGGCIRVASHGARHQPQLHEPNGQGSQTSRKRSVCPRIPLNFHSLQGSSAKPLFSLNPFLIMSGSGRTLFEPCRIQQSFVCLRSHAGL